jgi:acetoin utilization deacetylase AcuC-like enzyme
MKIIFSPECLVYEYAGHPESPSRVRSAYEYLQGKGYEFSKPKQASQEDILLVHSKSLLERVRNSNFFDPDTPNLENIFYYAALSAGAAIMAMELSLKGCSAFSLMRPPGHHATKDNLGGFCYFNNIAIASQKAIMQGKRTAILDIDCHHGNGTQDIFIGEKELLYVSLHQVPLYPGSGLKSVDNCLNYSLEPGCTEKDYLAVLESALSQIRNFSPQILGVSAGFDTYQDDPLTNIGLNMDSYREIANLISKLKLPTFSVLEGGYSPQLKVCLYEFLQGLT